MAEEFENHEEIKISQDNWREAATHFWANAAGEKNPAHKKQHRLKVLRWLAGTAHQLRIATGRSWQQFIIPAEEGRRSDPLEWPSITLAVDQGSDGWSAAYFLRSVFCNLILVFDMSHRIWNDLQLAIQDMGWWYSALLLVGVLNVDHGPWTTARWWEEIKDGAAEYLKITTRSCGVFQGYFHHIWRDMGNGKESIPTETDEERVFQSLPEAVEHKNAKIGMCRWLGLIDSLSAFLLVWHKRLVLIIYILNMVGIPMSSEKLHIRIAARRVDQDIEKSNTKDDREDVRQVRKGCQNSLVFTAKMLSWRPLWKIAVIICRIARPVRKFHSEQNKTNRSGGESVTWWTERAVDRGLQHVNEVIQAAWDTELLEQLGVQRQGCEHWWEQLAGDDPGVAEQNETAGQIWGFAFAVVRRNGDTAWDISKVIQLLPDGVTLVSGGSNSTSPPYWGRDCSGI